MESIQLESSSDAAPARLAAFALRLDPSEADPSALEALLETACAEARDRAPDSARRSAVRAMLKFGRYRASGRGKPACELLERFASEHAFPRISAAVDVLNAVSLRHRLPMSLVDLDRARTTTFRLRRGRAEERYVFNPSGQSIELRDLLLLATAEDDEPCANPVKDSMRTKLLPESSRIGVFVYGPDDVWMETALDDLKASYRSVWPRAELGHRGGSQ
ncbi:MAG: phenylalanine--tRNA ligase beta subunit-related protein [Myxococcota bacterium]